MANPQLTALIKEDPGWHCSPSLLKYRHNGSNVNLYHLQIPRDVSKFSRVDIYAICKWITEMNDKMRLPHVTSWYESTFCIIGPSRWPSLRASNADLWCFLCWFFQGCWKNIRVVSWNVIMFMWHHFVFVQIEYLLWKYIDGSLQDGSNYIAMHWGYCSLALNHRFVVFSFGVFISVIHFINMV